MDRVFYEGTDERTRYVNKILHKKYERRQSLYKEKIKFYFAEKPLV